VILTTHLVTLLPEWDTRGAFVTPMKPANTKDYAQTFNCQLRIERQEWYYIRQVFWLSYLMTIVSIMPLCIPNNEDQLGNRLGVYVAGMLTLVAFKYTVADHLPCVPYATFADDYLSLQIMTVSMCSMETVISWYTYDGLAEQDFIQDTWTHAERITFCVLFVFWTLYLLSVVTLKRHWKHSWEYVFSKDNLEGDFELNDPFDYVDLGIAEERLKEAKRETEEYRWWPSYSGGKFKGGYLTHILGGSSKHPVTVQQHFHKADDALKDLKLLRERLDTRAPSAD